MSRTWIFQANPKLYDIDAALRTLDRVWWRVPQHTGEVAAGDVVVVWRAGADAGVVALGRVASEPEERTMTADEAQFVNAAGEDRPDTRVCVLVKTVPFVPKVAVAALPTMIDHPIVTGPMGTVFRVEPYQWKEMSALLPDPPPAAVDTPVGRLPRPFSWAQRTKSIHPMPGGYDGYLESLAALCGEVVRQRPAAGDVSRIVRNLFDVTESRSVLLTSFLRKIGVIADDAGVAIVTDWGRRWLATGDARIIVALLHSRVRFVGEMLAELRSPQTTSALLRIANDRYGMGWSTKAQLDRRRGWLQSGRFVAVDELQRLTLTPQGTALLAELAIAEPPEQGDTAPVTPAPASEAAGARADVALVEAEPVGLASPPTAPVDLVVGELVAAATASTEPARFERAVREAFSFLGFRAEWLGGPGKTDVLLDAPLARDRSFRVIVDAKSSGSGAVTDQQIDWVTFTEHKAKHSADHVAVVAANPSGRRLFDRARQFDVVVFSAEQLADLCHQHARAPLGLEAYRKLFRSGGPVDVELVAEDAEEWRRLAALARSVIDSVAQRSSRFGPLFARDLTLILDKSEALDDAGETEIQSILDTLASPLVGVLAGSRADGYYVAMPPDVIARRLALLGGLLASADPAEDS